MKKQALNITIDEFTSPSPTFCSKETKVEEIKSIMEAGGIRHLPVIENDIPIGIISSRNITMISCLPGNDLFTAKDIMIDHPYCVQLGSPLEEVAFEMSKRKIGSAIIVDKSGKIEGIFTSTDGLNALIEIIRGTIE